jgi:RHS repeat-associated protein
MEPQPGTGTPQIQITNLHGDVVAQIPNTTGPVTGLDGWAETTEYGLTKTGNASLGQHYGWLGAKQRSTDTIGGLTLMGVRLYNPTTGRFLSRDPIPGGNDNTYTYPPDPINKFDLDGQWWSKKKWKSIGNKVGKIAGKGAQIASYCPLAQCQAAAVGLGAVSAGAYLAAGNKKKARRAAVYAAASIVTGGRGGISKMVPGKGRVAAGARTAARRAGGKRGGIYGVAWNRSGATGKAAVATAWWGQNVTWNTTRKR